jgi:hypothetical protein
MGPGLEGSKKPKGQHARKAARKDKINNEVGRGERGWLDSDFTTGVESPQHTESWGADKARRQVKIRMHGSSCEPPFCHSLSLSSPSLSHYLNASLPAILQRLLPLKEPSLQPFFLLGCSLDHFAHGRHSFLLSLNSTSSWSQLLISRISCTSLASQLFGRFFHDIDPPRVFVLEAWSLPWQY